MRSINNYVKDVWTLNGKVHPSPTNNEKNQIRFHRINTDYYAVSNRILETYNQVAPNGNSRISIDVKTIKQLMAHHKNNPTAKVANNQIAVRNKVTDYSNKVRAVQILVVKITAILYTFYSYAKFTPSTKIARIIIVRNYADHATTRIG